MAITLEQVAPFGRSLDEYQSLFNLSAAELSCKILGVGDGPASFNAEMTKLGHHVVSIDPLYAFAGQIIERQFYEVVEDIVAQVKATPFDWVWTYHTSPEDLRRNRTLALQTFLADYEQGKMERRYLVGELPHLSELADERFDLALCSHFLFLYSVQFGLDFHRAAVNKMLQVASEVRIFPLLTLQGTRSAFVEPVVQDVQDQGYRIEILEVGYELQRGGNQMLRITRD